MAEENKTTGGATGGGATDADDTAVIDLSELDQPTPAGGAPAGGMPSGGGAQVAAIAAAQPVGMGFDEQTLLAGAGAAMGPPAKFSVPSIVKEKFPDLIKLIKETESMNDDERDYWFQILPIMTEDQIKKFQDILINERKQLARLDKEYEQELTKLNEKHMVEWKEFESKEQRAALAKKETKAEKAERVKEDELLKRLAGY